MPEAVGSGKSPVEIFKTSLANNVSTGIAAIKGLMQVLEVANAKTLQELVALLKAETEKFKQVDNCSVITVTSASELFLRFITLAHTQLETQVFEDCLKLMLDRGAEFLHKLESMRGKVAEYFGPHVTDGGKILVHGESKVVLEALLHAAKSGKEFEVYLTTSGWKLKKQLDAANIVANRIEDMAIGYVMNKMDCVVLGAEGVCESGGIINQIGTLPIAIVAKQFNKPVYTLVESFKFVRFYPLQQDDLPEQYLERTGGQEQSEDVACADLHSRVDYTPPAHITLLFTDLGILTPSAVSDELIKIYL
uniref:Translation initiation factor eIF2B subunit alpha n=1 Tax=Acartia pacifica TaxID=335913 RepID=A0A0U2KD27_ACAPC|nr:translation initiation factor eIF-2B subunit alpha [Acartia pacifica]